MNRQVLLIIAIALAVGVGVGYWMAGDRAAMPGKPTQAEPEPLFYRNPMNPTITSPVPAQDSMGMDYIPVYADDAASGPTGTVSIDPVVVQNIGVRTAKVAAHG